MGGKNTHLAEKKNKKRKKKNRLAAKKRPRKIPSTRTKKVGKGTGVEIVKPGCNEPEGPPPEGGKRKAG